MNTLGAKALEYACVAVTTLVVYIKTKEHVDKIKSRRNPIKRKPRKSANGRKRR